MGFILILSDMTYLFSQPTRHEGDLLLHVAALNSNSRTRVVGAAASVFPRQRTVPFVDEESCVGCFYWEFVFRFCTLGFQFCTVFRTPFALLRFTVVLLLCCSSVILMLLSCHPYDIFVLFCVIITLLLCSSCGNALSFSCQSCPSRANTRLPVAIGDKGNSPFDNPSASF